MLACPDPDDRSLALVEKCVDSPIGTLRLVASARGLVAILWPTERDGRVPLGRIVAGTSAILDAATDQLAGYFAGRLRTFDIPLDPQGTPFQLAVWSALRAIPYGECRSYRDLATAIGRPTACRAVGAANGRNPLSIVVPCHRVIGSGGSLTGFAGGLEIKRHLLTLEGSVGEGLL